MLKYGYFDLQVNRYADATFSGDNPSAEDLHCITPNWGEWRASAGDRDEFGQAPSLPGERILP